MRKKRTIRKRPWQKLAAAMTSLAMVVSLGIAAGVPAESSHAAITGGQHSLLVEYASWGDVTTIPTDKLEATDFTLYKVGGFSRDKDGNPILVLDPKLDALNLDVDLAIDKKDPEWTDKWLASAQTIANAIELDETVIDEDNKDSKTMAKGETKCTFSGLSNGLYLLIGSSQKVTGYPTKDVDSYWCPQPMLVQILDGNQKVGVKPIAEVIRKFSLQKRWEGDENVASLVQPKQVTIRILYDGEQVGDPIVLPDENGTWGTTWKAGKGQNDPAKWAVEEVLSDADKANYRWSIEYTDTGMQRNYTLTNTYRRHTLEIEKDTPKYLLNNEALSTAVVFELTGKDAQGNQVYHNQVGMAINGPGKQTLTVSNIPTNIAPDGLTVKEIYSGGNYDPGTNPQTAKFTPGQGEDAAGVFSVSFTNSYQDETHYNSGIVNKYKLQEDNSYQIDDRQGLPSDKK